MSFDEAHPVWRTAHPMPVGVTRASSALSGLGVPETGPASAAETTTTYRAMAPASEPDPLPSENVE